MASRTESQDPLVMLALVLGGGYLAYQLLVQLGKLGKAAYQGAQTVTAPIADVIAWWWMLDDAPGVGSVYGNVLLPDGTRVPLSQLKVKQDSDHNVYVNHNGTVYQLSPSNSDGDWPATQVVGGGS